MVRRVNRLLLVVSLLVPVSLAVAGTAACSSSSAGAAGGPDASVTDAGATEEADAPAPCTAPPSQRPDGGTCVLEATGTVFDLNGTPLPQLVMTMCSPGLCYGTQSNEAGVYTVPIGDFLVTSSYAIHADGRPDHGVDYFRLGANEPEVISVDMHLPTLPPSSVQLPADDGGTATSVTVGDVTLQIAAGTTFDLDIEDFGTTAGRTLRVASVPLASAPAYAAANHIDAIYVLAPSGAKPSLPMGVALRNAAGLPAGSAVDVFVLSDDYFSVPPSVGTLLLPSTAHVSADGTTIQTDPGQGISEITWLAVRGRDQ